MYKRILRLVLAYYVQTIVNTIHLCILTGGSIVGVSFLKWFVLQFGFIGYTPDIMKDFATGSMNGALWTIPVELQMYFVLMILYPYLKKINVKKWLFLLGVSLLTNIFWGDIAGIISSNALKQIMSRLCLPYLIWFFIGVFCYVKFDVVIPFLVRRLYPMVGLFVILRALLGEAAGFYAPAYSSILLPFITISSAYKFKKVSVKLEISYGLYLYHWLVLNAFVCFELFYKLNEIVCLGLFIFISIVIAYLSIRFVEKPVSKIKYKL